MSTHADLFVGLRCLWRFKPRGGYGFVLRVPVRVLSLTAGMATILVENTGTRKTVSIGSLVCPPTMRNAVAEVVR